MKKIDLTGQKFGRLTVISESGRDKYSRVTWNCLCECGAKKIIWSNNLRAGGTKSCGCAASEALIKRNTTHGLDKGAEYWCWAGIKTRCYNPSCTGYKNYGGRGIKMCEQWLTSYPQFLSDIGKKPSRNHSIERRDNDGDYTPENCFWATKSVQANNTRGNRVVTINGKSRNRTQWENFFGIPTSTVSNRLCRGWDIIRALQEPIRTQHRKNH